MEDIINNLNELKELIEELKKDIPNLIKISEEVIDSLNNGKKILICGNGGSASQSQHMAAELVGRFKKERNAIAALALTTDTSILTSISNDYSFEDIFARQIQAIGQSGDILFGFSTSGNSKNVLKAFQVAKQLNIKTVAVCGKGGKIIQFADYVFKVNSSLTPRIQEIHLLFIHLLCEYIENKISHN